MESNKKHLCVLCLNFQEQITMYCSFKKRQFLVRHPIVKENTATHEAQ